MKMQLLGTAGGDFLRVDDAKDNFSYLPRVRELGRKNLRYAAQAIIYPDILIDFYDCRQMDAFGIAAESIKYLFITHPHWDHFQPLRILEFARELSHRLQVYGNQAVIDALKFADTYDFNRTTGRFIAREARTDIEYHVLESEQTLTVDETTIAAVHANHSIDKTENMIAGVPNLNYVFERDGKTIFYGLDSSYPLPLSVEFLRQFTFDAAVLDATFGQWPIDVVKSGHHNLAMLAETIEEFREAGIVNNGTNLLASHISLAYAKPHDDLKEEASQSGVTLAYDGMVVNV